MSFEFSHGKKSAVYIRELPFISHRDSTLFQNKNKRRHAHLKFNICKGKMNRCFQQQRLRLTFYQFAECSSILFLLGDQHCVLRATF